jgi:hypothetical protein
MTLLKVKTVTFSPETNTLFPGNLKLPLPVPTFMLLMLTPMPSFIPHFHSNGTRLGTSTVSVDMAVSTTYYATLVTSDVSGGGGFPSGIFTATIAFY